MLFGQSVQALDADLEGLDGSLKRLVENAPYKPYCSNNKTAGRILPFHYARQYEYMQINPPSQVYWLIFDIDQPNPYIWEEANLPPPNIITISPDTQKSHFCYAIEPVCVSSNGSQKAIAYMKAVRNAYTRALKADLDYSSPVTKNPLHPRWKTWSPTDHVYSLDELADYTAIDLSPGNTPFFNKEAPFVKDMEDPEGRNCTLFLQLRTWTYCEVASARAESTYEDWLDLVIEKAEKLNSAIGQESTKGALRFSEVKATAKSVARWTWDKYTGSTVNRGVMAMSNTDIPLVSKQRLSARRTHEVRRNKTEEKLLAHVRLLFTTNRPITRCSIAKSSGTTRQTVSKYWAAVERFKTALTAKAKDNRPIMAVDTALAVNADSGSLATLGSLSRNTGIDRRTIKSAYPALFDP